MSSFRSFDARWVAKAVEYDKQANDQVKDGYERVRLFYNDYTIVLVKNPGENHWLLTGYEKENKAAEYASGADIDASTATTDMTTPSRHTAVDSSTYYSSLHHDSSTGQAQMQRKEDNPEIIAYLNEQVEDGEYVTTYKAFSLIEGQLFPTIGRLL